MQLRGKGMNIAIDKKNVQICSIDKKNQQIYAWHKHYYILYLYVPRIRFYVNFCYNGSKKIGANFKKNFL